MACFPHSFRDMEVSRTMTFQQIYKNILSHDLEVHYLFKCILSDIFPKILMIFKVPYSMQSLLF